MIDRLKMLVLKIVFSPLWLIICFVLILFYVTGKTIECVVEGESFKIDFSDFCRLFEYWRL